MIASNNSDTSSLGSFQSVDIQPFLEEPYNTGNANCSSVASKLKNKSNTFSYTSSGRQFSLSTLLTTTKGFKPNAKAFCVTKRV
ncbi:hypothetical protein D3C86_1685290 [compost metagenome]